MNPHDDTWDEEQLGRVLNAADCDHAPPDQEFLKRLRDQSAKAFSESTPNAPRSRVLIRRFAGWLAAAAAVVIAVVLLRGSRDRSGLAFGEILDQLARAETLHFKVTRDGAETDVYVRHPDKLRWELADRTYRIADGEQVWLINESENTAVPYGPDAVGVPIRYFRTDAPGVDVYSLLGVAGSATTLASDQLKPVSEGYQQGELVYSYRSQLVRNPSISVEADVDGRTKQLLSMRLVAAAGLKEQPIAELTLVAVNEPIADDRFLVSDTLTEDGRIGKIADVQGIVSLRPVMAERWTPVTGRMLVRPGDWLRTDARGANAVAVRLVKETSVILGPATLAELVGPRRIRIHSGELEATAPAAAKVELVGPAGQPIAVDGATRVRVQNDKLARLDREPLWLRGFKGATTTESLGSLVANVDGRNVPLTVGYHKVTVDIRDQIARTEIEESFVNHTDSQLEGVFYFPLPQDASISGFGMWIGDSLVEADVVEKELAREIYETILRERRDPGLLEWTGGNIFKARVFPIFAHSEKRIKISYTQVLPLRGNSFRYGYALQSELLRQYPLRELAIDVRVHSAQPVAKVSCPTHSARTDFTQHAGHVEFTAQEYTPARDLEVVVELDGRRSDVALVPHRRGDDGYFMLLLNPPAAAGEWQRELVRDGEPLELVILADTSASMDRSQRAVQSTLVAALLAALGEKDRFNLAACDVECDFVFEQPQPVSEKNRSAALDFLTRRDSLGWTDLDKALAAVPKRAGPRSHVVYIGDGIVTTGDANPVAFGQRLRRLYGNEDGGSRIEDRSSILHPPSSIQSGPAFHAIATGSSFEPAVLRAIASLGGGSMRRIGGEQGPQAVALELLGEITQPTLRDVKVEFRGLATARVYPEHLPNVPAGSQQILFGRYLPMGRDQAGEVVVSGAQGGKPVRLSTRVSLADADDGNSYIPRLWARMHVDQLLEQGQSESIKDEIIALSEQFHIMTPYTSLLVLETDADRERFKVKRRFQMRDGERFFASGRDAANFELIGQQMKRAGTWRLGLRRSVLAQLAGLGRNTSVFQPPHARYLSDDVSWFDKRVLGAEVWPVADLAQSLHMLNAVQDWSYPTSVWSFDGTDVLRRRSDLGVLGDVGDVQEEQMNEAGEDADDAISLEVSQSPAPEQAEAVSLEYLEFEDDLAAAEHWAGAAKSLDGTIRRELRWLPARLARFESGGFGGRGYFQSPIPEYGRWLTELFPPLRGVPTKPPAAATKTVWPDEARELARSLIRTDKLFKLDGGVEIVRQWDDFDRWGELDSRRQTIELYSPREWLTRREAVGEQTIVEFCDAKDRGAVSETLQLGRVRRSAPTDLATPPLELIDFSIAGLDESYGNYEATVQKQDDDRVVLTLKHSASKQEERFVIDAQRRVIVSRELIEAGKPTHATRFSDFVEVAGCWWAQRIEGTGPNGQPTFTVSQTVRHHEGKPFAQLVAERLRATGGAQLIHRPLPQVAAAKQSIAAGQAIFDDHIVLMLHFSASQQWTRVFDHLAEAERTAGNKPGLEWLRDAVLRDARRHEELRRRLVARVQAAGFGRPSEDLFLAEHTLNQADGVVGPNEMLDLVARLEPIYKRQPAHAKAEKRWLQRRPRFLREVGRDDEALLIERGLAAQYPHDYTLQHQLAQSLAGVGDHEAAYEWLRKVITPEAKWLDHEEQYLRRAYTGLLEGQGRFDDIVRYLEAWFERSPAAGYDEYLAALVRSDRVDRANELAAEWLKAGRAIGELSPAEAARLRAAVAFMLGQGHNLYIDRIDDRWLRPLADAVLFFSRHATLADVAETIMGQWRFTQTDECRRLRGDIARVIADELDKLTPEQLGRLVRWIMTNDPPVDDALWRRVAGHLRALWSDERDPLRRNQLAETLVLVLRDRIGAAELLEFLRVQLREAADDARLAAAVQLFEALLAQPWSAELLDEAMQLLDKLAPTFAPTDDLAQRLVVQLAALHRLTDHTIKSRFDMLVKSIEHPEKLTRIELRTKRAELLRQARIEAADRLNTIAAARDAADPLTMWLVAERLYVDTLAERDLKQVEATCWKLLESLPKPGEEDAAVDEPIAADHEPDASASLGRLVAMLRQRLLVTIAHLTARKGAEPASADRLIKFLDSAIADQPAESAWAKQFKHQLLIALDRPAELRRELEAWVRAGDRVGRWRVSLGYLLAELGEIGEAIRQFEAVESPDELGAAEYQALAAWYTIIGRREQHDRAKIAAYKTMDEWHLSQRISRSMTPWLRTDGGVPRELDGEVLLVFAALFEKSGQPQSYLWQLQQFYQASRDFRLLAGLADAVVGQSAERVYPFLGGMQSVLNEIRDEATADSIIERIVEVRQRAKTPVDQRALDLLEMQTERRAAEVLNQPGPHIAAAVAALERATQREWTAGEPRHIAEFLASLGTIAAEPLARAVLDTLESLHRNAAAGTMDRLHIAYRRAISLWHHSRAPEASDLLEVALREIRDAHEGKLPVQAHEALGTFVYYLEDRGHFARGEQVLVDALKRPVHGQQARWLTQRLYELYQKAIAADGETALGKGQALYRAVEQKLRADIATPDQHHRYALLERLRSVYVVAHAAKLRGVADDLREFAMKHLGDSLRRQTVNYQAIVTQFAQTLNDIAGPRDAVAFLIDRIEREPAWLRYRNEDGWNQFCWHLGQWRVGAEPLGEFEPRLLKIITDELRRDLETQQQRNRAMYHADHNHYWAAQADAFAKVADEVFAARRRSHAAMAHVADYVFHGLKRRDRAIEMLLLAHQDGVLNESGQAKLVDFLHRTGRYGESIALLLPLVEKRPDNMQYRVWLMHAYFRMQRRQELVTLLDQTDKYFHEDGRWQEGAMVALARSCLENELYERAVVYYKELIPLYERSRPGRGIGDGTLSSYYDELATAHAGLKQTAEGVDAACGAIVSWGPRHDGRAGAIETLRTVLRDSPDLDGYVAILDKETAETGQDKPIVRKALGEVYLEQKDHAKARAQLEAAVALQPNDAETHRALVRCFDEQGDKAGAIRQLVQSCELNRRAIELYRDLGRRFQEVNDAAAAERAYTAIIDALPNESEGHALVAEIREQQERWPDAIAHWEQVARIRSLEPTGLVRLAAAQIGAKQWDQAAQTIAKLKSRSWPSRFTDVEQKTRELEQRLRRDRQ
jgi:tetratricopeptide (TPR) repeat protein